MIRNRTALPFGFDRFPSPIANPITYASIFLLCRRGLGHKYFSCRHKKNFPTLSKSFAFLQKLYTFHFLITKYSRSCAWVPSQAHLTHMKQFMCAWAQKKFAYANLFYLCSREDSNLHPLRETILSRPRIPFRHSSIECILPKIELNCNCWNFEWIFI